MIKPWLNIMIKTWLNIMAKYKLNLVDKSMSDANIKLNNKISKPYE